MPRQTTRLQMKLAAVPLLAAAALAGCGGSGKAVTVTHEVTVQAVPKVPAPPLARLLPPGYVTLHVYRASLGGSRVPEAIVTSTGPPVGGLGFHSADLQVLSWDGLARRWTVSFDAQKVFPPELLDGPQASNAGPGSFAGALAAEPPEPILDPEADVELGQVRFASILPGARKQLVFSATTSYGGSGSPVSLVVVDVEQGSADVAYLWRGEGLRWRLAGVEVRGRAPYWTLADAHCCPSREYDFMLAARDGAIAETADERPYLGVLVRPAGGDADVTSPLEVIRIADGSSASARLRVGDVIVDVANPRRGEKSGSLGDRVRLRQGEQPRRGRCRAPCRRARRRPEDDPGQARLAARRGRVARDSCRPVRRRRPVAPG